MEKEINSLGNVHVDKNQLLDIVSQNREKHNLIYSVAVSGYNLAVNDYLKKVQSESERVAELAKQYSAMERDGKQFDKTGLHFVDCYPPNAPKSYEHEYTKTIMKLKLSTADNIQLVDGEFEQYVLNNWKWKGEFLGSNTSYVNGVSGCIISTGSILGGSAIFLSGLGVALDSFNQ